MARTRPGYLHESPKVPRIHGVKEQTNKIDNNNNKQMKRTLLD